MKKLIVMFFALLCSGLYFTANAQCTPPAPTGDAGLSPDWPCLNCAVQGVAYDEVLNVENFTTVGGITISQLIIDSLTNTPTGLSYSITPDNTFATGETGCVSITGTTNDTVGSYRIGIYVTVTLTLGTFSGEASEIVDNLIALGIIDTNTTTVPNFAYFLRVVADAQDCVIDDSCTAAINELSSVFSQPVAQPNPFNNKTEISWNSTTSGKYFAKVYDVVGKEVYAKEVNVIGGTNSFVLERGDMTKGAYFFVLSDGNKSITTKLVIRD